MRNALPFFRQPRGGPRFCRDSVFEGLRAFGDLGYELRSPSPARLGDATSGFTALFESELPGRGLIRMTAAMRRLNRRNARLENLVTEIAEGTVRLLRVVEDHEGRISDLEGAARAVVSCAHRFWRSPTTQ